MKTLKWILRNSWMVLLYSTMTAMAGGYLLYRLGQFTLRHRHQPHGRAHFATNRELRQSKFLGADGIILGKQNGAYVSIPHSRNAISFGRPGCGKTAGLMIPNLLMHPDWTIIVVDPKGSELFQQTHQYRRMMGNTVHRLHPQFPEQSIQCNPLQILEGCNRYSLTSTLESLAKQIFPQRSPQEEHWDLLAQMIWSGVARHLWETDRSRCTLPQTAELITAQDHDFFVGFVRQIQQEGCAQARAAASAFLVAGSNEQGSFCTSLKKRLKVWTDEGVAALSDSNGLRWEDVLQGPTPSTVFLNMPSGKSDYFGSWIRVLLGSLLLEATRLYDETGRSFDRPILLLIDEADSLGYSEQIDTAIAKIRGMGISIVLCMQSKEQLESAYGPKRAQALWDSCEAKTVTGGEHNLELLRLMSELGGDITINSQNHSASETNRSEGESQTARRLVKPDEIRAAHEDEQFIVMGRHFVHCTKAYWFRDPRMKQLLEA